MLLYIVKRILYVLPVALGVSLVCFMLVHIAPGDPLTAMLPADASAETQQEMRAVYGFDKPLPVQYGLWLGRVVQRRSRHVHRHRAGRLPPRSRRRQELARAGGLRDADRLLVRHAARRRRRLFPGRAGSTGWCIARRGARRQRAALLAGHGAGDRVLGAAQLAAGHRRRPGGSANVAGLGRICATSMLPAVTMSVIPMGIIARTVKALVGEILQPGIRETGARRRRAWHRRRVPPRHEERRAARPSR